MKLTEIKKGIKLRRPDWKEGSYIYLKGNIIKFEDGSNAYITGGMLKANDFMVVKDKNTLSDNEFVGNCYRAFRRVDAKQSLKDFLDYLEGYCLGSDIKFEPIKKQAKELFGEDLLS